MIIVILVLLGLIFGSFINALVWRLHEQEELREEIGALEGKKGSKKRLVGLQKRLAERSMLHGRSMCSHCHHELAAKDLIPLFSWLWLRGKCRYCGVRIQDSPWIEGVLPLLFVGSYLFWPEVLSSPVVHGPLLLANRVQFGFWLVFLIAFMALAAYDLRWYILPNRIVFPLIALAAVQVITITLIRHDVWILIDAFIGALVISGLFWMLFVISGGNWIGGGDVKLAVVLGALAGSAVQSLLLLFFASVIGTVFSIPQLLKGRQGLKMHVPFGPFLLAGTVVVVLFGHGLVDWYTGLLSVHSGF